MPRIRILPEVLASKIAAGEIVERPSSIVKELIENSIDAESTKIVIEINNGGTSLIRVSDNGIGMSRDDTLLSLERYATSKIKTSEDLFSIKTLGFRGEAIPSIASVSNFSIISRERYSNIGTKIKVKGGKIETVCDYGAPSGVMVTVEDLFFNIPARKKFLKSIKTETIRISNIVNIMAIAKHQIRFKLIHNGKLVKDWLNLKNKISRLGPILGNNLESKLIEIRAHIDNIYVKGWITKPHISRTTSKGIYIFVNGRYIKDKFLHQSLISGYNGKLVKGKYPIVIIFLRVPYNELDVNVHPAKLEVKFLDQKKIGYLLHNSIIENLSQTDGLKWNQNSTYTNSILNKKNKFKFNKSVGAKNYHKTNNIRDEKPLNKVNFSKNHSLSTQEKLNDNIINFNQNKVQYIKNQSILWEEKFFSNLEIIGQYLNTYIVCESKEALILIDQHAAHERIIFEKLQLKINQNKPVSQNLLLPEIIEINSNEIEIFTELMSYLNNYGFKIQPFGNRTFVITSIPALISNYKIEVLIFELIQKISKVGIKKGTNSIMHECLSIIACHNTIKAKQRLEKQEVKKILGDLDQCKNTSNCPHGRPIWIELKTSDLEKRFYRK